MPSLMGTLSPMGGVNCKPFGTSSFTTLREKKGRRAHNIANISKDTQRMVITDIMNYNATKGCLP